MNTNTDTATTAAGATAAIGEDLRNQLKSMVARAYHDRSKDWEGINKLLIQLEEYQQQQKQQHQHHDEKHPMLQHDTMNDTADRSDNNNDIEEIIRNDFIPLSKQLLSDYDSDPAAKALFLTLIRLGGRDYVTISFDYDVGEGYYLIFGTLLHYAVRHNPCIEILKKLIEVGGRDLLIKKDDTCFGRNALNLALALAFKCGCDYFPLCECECEREGKISIDVVKELIRAGGRDLVFDKTKHGANSLHWACYCNASIDIIQMLIEVGGRDLVLDKDGCDGLSSLHCACQGRTSVDVLDLLIQHGGRDVLTQVHNYGMTPLHSLIADYCVNYGVDHREQKGALIIVENASFLINKSIELQIGGQYSIGGLFNNDHNTSRRIQDANDAYWNNLVLPVLEHVMAMSNNQHHLPILQALIINEAPPHILKIAVDTFSDSINTRDSFDKYPIDVAIENDLSWDDGLEQIVRAFAFAQQTAPLNVCAKHGLQWENGTKLVLENDDNVDIILDTADTSTGLYPFMMAAVGGRDDDEPNYGYDFDSIFHLIKSRPLVVRRFGAEKQLSSGGKRKRSW